MADFVAVLKKTLDGLSDTTPQMREKVYEKARITIASKLAAMNPPLPDAVIQKQRQALEEAIVKVEGEYARKPVDPLSELESVFASLKNPDPHVVLKEPVRAPAVEKPVQPAVPAPVVAKPSTPAAAATAAAPPARTPTATAPVSVAEAPKAPAAAPKPANGAAQKDVAPATALDVAEEAWPDDDMSERRAPVDDLFRPVQDDDDDQIVDDEPEPRRRYGRLIAAALVVAIIAGGGYGAWLKWSELQQMLARAGVPVLDSSEPQPTPAAPASEPPAPAVAAVEPPAQATPEPETQAPAAPEPAGPQKFTQRLNADGTESDAGPAGGAPVIGEGTSIAAVTQPSLPAPDADAAPAAGTTPPDAETPAADAAPATQPSAPGDTAAAPSAESGTPAADAAPSAGTPPATPDAAAPDAAASDGATPDATAPGAATSPAGQPAPAQPTQSAQEQSVPVGQKAIFYEERTNVADASAEPGSIVWSLVQESPGGDLPPEPAIRAEATIPGKDVQLRMTIRRNADRTLPASHIVEMIFLTPQGFEGGGIENVLRVSLKGSEQEAGSPLLGIPAKIADGFFLIALNDSKPEIDANTRLLRSQSWIDVPVQYKSGRRALFTMEKGIPGAKVFDEALKAWQTASSG